MDNFIYKNKNAVEQAICCLNLIMLLNGHFEYLINKCDDKHKINKNVSLTLFNTKILYYMFYKKLNKKVINKIKKILNIIGNSLVVIQPNRHYSRIRKTPTSVL